MPFWDHPPGPRSVAEVSFGSLNAPGHTFTGLTFGPHECALVGVASDQFITSVSGGGLAWTEIVSLAVTGGALSIWKGIGPKTNGTPVSGDVQIDLLGTGEIAVQLIKLEATDDFEVGITNTGSSAAPSFNAGIGRLTDCSLAFCTWNDGRRSYGIEGLPNNNSTEEVVFNTKSGSANNQICLSSSYEPARSQISHTASLTASTAWTIQSIFAIPPTRPHTSSATAEFTGRLRNQKEYWYQASTPPATTSFEGGVPLRMLMVAETGFRTIDQPYLSFAVPADHTVESAVITWTIDNHQEDNQGILDPDLYANPWAGDRPTVNEFIGPTEMATLVRCCAMYRHGTAPFDGQPVKTRTFVGMAGAVETASRAGVNFKLNASFTQHAADTYTSAWNEIGLSNTTNRAVLEITVHPIEAYTVDLSPIDITHGTLTRRDGVVDFPDPAILSALEITHEEAGHPQIIDIELGRPEDVGSLVIFARITRSELGAQKVGNLLSSGIRTGSVQ